MTKLNTPIVYPRMTTHEGAPAPQINAEKSLRRSLMSCLLWEGTFYESGVDIAARISELVPKIAPEKVAEMAIEAREKMKLRHAPLWVVREMARHAGHKRLVAKTLERVIQRADELSEFMAMYWKDGRCPISAQVKKGLALAFQKFDAYALGKYNRDGAVKLRDVLFLCHAHPRYFDGVNNLQIVPPLKKAKYRRGSVRRHPNGQGLTWKQLIDGTLESPDTWEVALSTGQAKKETWERLLSENKLGAMALLRNLRNMKSAGVSDDLVKSALSQMKVERVLPYRFISAAKYAPQLEPELEQAMFKCLAGQAPLPGKTILLIDVSGSMAGKVSYKSEITRAEAAGGLAILARELCKQVSVYTFNDRLWQLPARRGLSLKDAIVKSVSGGTRLGAAVNGVMSAERYDRLIVLTDEQSTDIIPIPRGKAYMVNVAPYQNGIGYYGAWTHIDGWSEAILTYISEAESVKDE